MVTHFHNLTKMKKDLRRLLSSIIKMEQLSMTPFTPRLIGYDIDEPKGISDKQLKNAEKLIFKSYKMKQISIQLNIYIKT